MFKPDESDLRLCDCEKFWDSRMSRQQSALAAEEGHPRHAIFRNVTQPKSFSTGLVTLSSLASHVYCDDGESVVAVLWRDEHLTESELQTGWPHFTSLSQNPSYGSRELRRDQNRLWRHANSG